MKRTRVKYVLRPYERQMLWALLWVDLSLVAFVGSWCVVALIWPTHY